MQLPKSLTTVTTFSKIMALSLFILLPFTGFYLGIKYQESLTPKFDVENFLKIQEQKQRILLNKNFSVNTKRYTSKNLHITFLYNENINHVQKSTIKEIGNKIYIYTTISGEGDYLHGKHLEVFEKSPNISLEEAVKEKLLKGYSETLCKIESQNPSIVSDNFKVIRIQFKASDPKHPFDRANECPLPYTWIESPAVFVEDKNHPDKFLFINIGLYSLPAGDNEWHQTIQFTD